jgi:hypothetical protein
LPCCTADGESYAKAIESVQVVIDERIEMAREMRRMVLKPRGRVSFPQ